MYEIVNIYIGIHGELKFSFSHHFISNFQPLVMQNSISSSLGIPRVRDKKLLVCV